MNTILKPLLSAAGAVILACSAWGQGGDKFDHALNMRRVPGEIMPVLPGQNLLKNSDFSQGLSHWSVVGDGKAIVVKDGRYPAVKLTGNGTAFALLSAPFELSKGKKYSLTGVYHTGSAKFGSGCELKFVREQELKKLLKEYTAPGHHTNLFRRALVNRPAGEYFRKIVELTPTDKSAGTYRAALVVSGAPFEILWSSLYLGETPAKDSRIGLYKEKTDTLDPKYPEAQALQILAERGNAEGEIKADANGYAQIFINGKVVPSVIFFGDSSQPYRSKRKSFQKAGVALQIIRLRYNNRLWRGNGLIDFKKIDKIITDSVYRNPHGYYIIGIDLSPYQHWAKDFPDDAECDKYGKYVTNRLGIKAPPSYWSANYRQKALEYLTVVIEHMKKQPYWSAVVGIFPHGNNDGQFFYQGTRTGGGTLQDGHAKSAAVMYREYLRKKYGTVDNLRRAWHDAAASFDTAASPVDKKHSKLTFLDSTKHQQYIDFVQFLNESFGEFANLLGETAKKIAGKKIFTVMWFDRGGTPRVEPYFSMSKVMLPGQGVDAFSAQTGYHDNREAGQVSSFVWCFDSDRIHGKLMIEELDYRTKFSAYKTFVYDTHVARFWTLKDFVNASLRQLGCMYAIGGGIWWFPLTDGWYLDDDIMGEMKKMQDIARLLSEKNSSFTPADTVLISDESSYYRTAEQIDVWNGQNYNALRNNQRALVCAGIKFDYYFLNDVLERNMDNYKVYIFANSYRITPETECFIEKLKRNGKTVVFLYAAGYQTADGLSDKNMSRILGMEVKLADNGSKLADFSFANHPLAAGLTGCAGIGADLRGERFVVTDPEAVVLARYRSGNAPAVAVKNNVVYVGNPAGLTPQFVRNLVKNAGGRIYNRTAGDLFMYHRDDLVVLHGVEGNENVLDFPGNVEFYDLYACKVLDGNVVKLAPGETKLLLVKEKKGNLTK